MPLTGSQTPVGFIDALAYCQPEAFSTSKGPRSHTQTHTYIPPHL